MPEWFRTYLNELDEAQTEELMIWLDHSNSYLAVLLIQRAAKNAAENSD